MSGVVDYSNYDDMKYAVSFISLQRKCSWTYALDCFCFIVYRAEFIFLEASVGSLMFP